MAHAEASKYSIVLVTAPSKAQAEAIATALVQERLAACVSYLPVTSIYTWQHQLHRDEEWQLIIKTEGDRIPALEARVQALHPYDVPEIVAIPLSTGAESYLTWITAQVHPGV
jgi:periplasmic divalent cation tolerance protein